MRWNINRVTFKNNSNIILDFTYNILFKKKIKK